MPTFVGLGGRCVPAESSVITVPPCVARGFRTLLPELSSGTHQAGRIEDAARLRLRWVADRPKGIPAGLIQCAGLD
ncbi:hypothetical protein WUBG_18038 [Wuchereria bancrofti]|uniref:Uncharacterized protein n=1 Tax=Wuchereria bancrofti TaxID=6293 RepID=J9DNJ9_WUCBA|nr:hypothetical protein WUBG_18035 [Wuchereria bancrofti]EJW71056.1 hypothetical protein WUBG_18038 [Wuchereria bancrofti]